jgi:hypothetical protein
MSVQTAFQFIQQLRSPEGLKNRLVAQGSNADLESFVKLGAEVGLAFNVEELEEAHKRDWAMRWLLYNK